MIVVCPNGKCRLLIIIIQGEEKESDSVKIQRKTTKTLMQFGRLNLVSWVAIKRLRLISEDYKRKTGK